MRKPIVIALAATVAVAVTVPTLASPPPPPVRVKIGDDFFVKSTFNVPTIHVAQFRKLKFFWTGQHTHNVYLVAAPKGYGRKFHSKDQTNNVPPGHHPIYLTPRSLSKKGTYTFMCMIHGFQVDVKVK
jgi:plastocyanin